MASKSKATNVVDIAQEDSPIESIFYCEFHPTAGPMIVYQSPPGYVSKEAFDSLSDYLIPKTELERRLLTVNALGLKIIGYPVGIDHARYARNRLIFNLCFVCRPSMRTFQYEPIVKKLANYLVNLELECGYLSKPIHKEKLPGIMTDIMEQLNKFRVCRINITSSTTINLKIVKVHPDPEQVHNEQVPVFSSTRGIMKPSQWDLTTQQIIPYIDGFRHISKIAAEADVEVSLVKACIQNMIYYGIVTLISIFQYSNFYVPTHRLVELNENLSLQQECVKFVTKHSGTKQDPSFRSIYKMYCNMNYGITVRDLCLQYNPNSLNIDEKKLVRFGLMKGIIRRVHKYPVVEDNEHDGNKQGINPRIPYDLFDGNHNYDQICCKAAKFNLGVRELNDDVERNDDILLINK